MVKNYARLQSFLIRFVWTCSLSLISCTAALAQDDNNQKAESINRLQIISDTLNEMADKEDENIRQRNQEVEELKKLLMQGGENLSEAQKKIDELAAKTQEQKRLQDESNRAMQEMQKNFDKYVFQTRAEKYMPILYAIAAVYFSNGDAKDKPLYALAGYGTGALIENTHYGTARLITYFKFRF